MTEDHSPTVNYDEKDQDQKANGEIKNATSGGCKSWFGIDQIDWGGEADKFYACWKVNPCCGSPSGCKMVTCFLCWCFCHCCSLSKMFASSLGQECAFVPHCLLACFLPCIAHLFVRTNLRNRLGVQGNMVGDAICCCCCGCCSFCQELRSVQREEWNLIEPKWQSPKCSAPQIMCLK